MLGVGGVFLIVLVVDVVCGPLMTLILASPKKSIREISLDLGLIGIIQTAALVYGLHAVWVGRPAVLAFENDRLVILSANEIESTSLITAPQALQKLPFSGVLKISTRKPKDNSEFLRSVDLSLAGLSPAMRPNWWEPMDGHLEKMREKVKPLNELIARRPDHVTALKAAAADAGYTVDALGYLPLTSSTTRDWVVLLNSSMEMVGYASVDGF